MQYKIDFHVRDFHKPVFIFNRTELNTFLMLVQDSSLNRMDNIEKIDIEPIDGFNDYEKSNAAETEDEDDED